MSLYQKLDLVLLLLTLVVLAWTLLWVRAYTKAAQAQATHADTTARAAVEAATAARQQIEVSRQQTAHFEATAKAAVEQAEAAQKPCVSVQWRIGQEWVFGNGWLTLINIGNGPALGISYRVDKPDGESLETQSDLLLERGGWHRTRVTNILGTKFNNDKVDIRLQDYGDLPELVVKAQYRSMSGTAYDTRQVIKNSNNGFWYSGRFDFGPAPLAS